MNHIRKVLRLRCGDSITVCDGESRDYTVQIQAVESDRVVTEITGVKPNGSEPPIGVALFQGIPKSDKMDFIIQKSVELGIDTIVPVSTERTVVRIDNRKDAEAKTVRWQRIALEAAKQCNRGRIPRVLPPMGFRNALELSSGYDLGLIPYEKEAGNRLENYLHKDHLKSICVFIGPEGGYSEAEIDQAISAGIIPVSLGPRILRTETAGIMVLSILMYTLGDL